MPETYNLGDVTPSVLADHLNRTSHVPFDPDNLSIEMRRSYLRYPPTNQVRVALAALNILPRDGNTTPEEDQQRQTRLAFYSWRLARCKERDAIQATRPKGCFCLGVGMVEHRYCPCPTGTAQRQADTVESLQHRNNLRRTWWDKYSGVPERFRDYRWHTSPSYQSQSELMGRMMSDKDASWYLWGQYGRGKTGLAVSWLWESLDDAVYFVTVPDLLAKLRRTYGQDNTEDENQIIAEYSDVGYLVLDDLGAEQVKNQEWVSDRLYQIIGARHGHNRPTVFTSNYSLADMAHRIGERITWRIIEMCGESNIVHLDGPNLREGKAQNG